MDVAIMIAAASRCQTDFECYIATRFHGRTRRFVLLGTAIYLALAACEVAATGAESNDRPNIIFILTDDQGYGDLGCYGSKTIATPNIDRLASEGTRLTNFYAAAPICTPTRAALLTGCYATRVSLPTPLHVYDPIGLADSETTLAEALQARGYRTGCIGKWHLGHHPQFYPTRHGFDVYWGTPLGHMFDRPAVGKAVGDTSDLFLDNEKPIPFPAHEDATERLTEQALKFIRANRQRPFFLYLAHTMPHEPLSVSQRFAGKSKGGIYGDVIECIDWSTGQVIKALAETELTEKTIVIFTSDNGPKPGHGSAGPLRGFKHEPYEGGMRVPFVVWGPRRIPAGRTIDSMVAMIDIYPTCAALAGAKVSQQQVVDGVDFSPQLLAASEAAPRKEFFYFVRHGVLAGVRQGRWKLLVQKGKTELFDLAADVGESKNLAAEQPQIVQRLSKRMHAFAAEVEAQQRVPGKVGE